MMLPGKAEGELIPPSERSAHEPPTLLVPAAHAKEAGQMGIERLSAFVETPRPLLARPPGL
jgi:hypothetical protein